MTLGSQLESVGLLVCRYGLAVVIGWIGFMKFTAYEANGIEVNPSGGSVALGHPFGATGTRISSQAVKALSSGRAGRYGIVSIRTDGGQGAVVLRQSADRPARAAA